MITEAGEKSWIVDAGDWIRRLAIKYTFLQEDAH
jgi:hypothetical protein